MEVTLAEERTSGGRAWLLLAVGDNRQHGGNDGYDDDPAKHYSWDSTVPNHAALRSGDKVAIWDKRELLGVSVIEQIETEAGTKDRYSCPSCGFAKIKQRKTKVPLYKCYGCRSEFESPVVKPTQVTTYRSRHDVAWIDLAGSLSGSELRALCESPRAQLSLRPLRWNDFCMALDSQRRAEELGLLDSSVRRLNGGHEERTVRVRVGQASFRRLLLDRYGEACAFTGPAPACVLEAAHLYSYAAVGIHHEHGGLLLRRDLHRLFDLGYLKVEPEGLRVRVAPSLGGFPEYAAIDGRMLGVELSESGRSWLRLHSSIHRWPE